MSLTLDNKNHHGRLAERIARRLEEIGKSATAVSRASGKGPDFIRDYLSGRKSSMSADAMARIARELGVTVAWLQGDDAAKSEPAPEVTAQARTVPVFGSIPSERAGFKRISTEIVEMLPCPHGLDGVRDAYALYVVGVTMEPRFRQGELVFVTPHRPARPGDDVVVTIRTESGEAESCLAQFTGESDGKLCMRQHNPSRKIFFERSQVVEIDRVCPINDLIGR